MGRTYEVFAIWRQEFQEVCSTVRRLGYFGERRVLSKQNKILLQSRISTDTKNWDLWSKTNVFDYSRFSILPFEV